MFFFFLFVSEFSNWSYFFFNICTFSKEEIKINKEKENREKNFFRKNCTPKNSSVHNSLENSKLNSSVNILSPCGSWAPNDSRPLLVS